MLLKGCFCIVLVSDVSLKIITDQNKCQIHEEYGGVKLFGFG